MKVENLNKVQYFFTEGTTRNGVKFDLNSNTWKIVDNNKKIILCFDKLHMDSNNIFNIKNVFKWYIENNSITHCGNLYEHLKNLIKFIVSDKNQYIKQITEIDLINYRSHIGQKKEWYIGSLSGFLKKSFEMGYSLISKEAYAFLKESTFKGNSKGEAVLTMCPIQGPFSDIELETIQDAINNSYSKNEIKLDDYILVWLFMIFGSRPIQFAQLKIKDVIISNLANNQKEIIINIPTVKNRKKARSEFKKRIIPNALSRVFEKFVLEQKKILKNLDNLDNLDNLENAPLFFDPEILKNNNLEFKYLEYHLKSDEIKNKMDNIFNTFNIKSERTGEKLNVIPIRFRRTIGTRAASEGYGELIIAEILDHKDTQNAGVYTQATPEIIERIDRAIALEMAPLAQAFAGVLLDDKSKAIRANDSSADIVDPKIDPTCKPTGKCGTYSFCGLMSPIACYTCNSFQAWSDGPHEKVLRYLLEERERLLKMTDYRIASINDKTILAVAQVVIACKKFNIENEIEVLV